MQTKKEKRRAQAHKCRDAKPEAYWFADALKRARRRGVCTLKKGDLALPAVCPVLGSPLVYTRGKGRAGSRDSSPSLDRIDPAKGYTPDNTIVVSQRANRIKNNATPEELRKVAQFYNQATPLLLETQKRAPGNIIPGAVLAGLLAQKPGFVEDVERPDDDFGGISRDTIEFSHD